MSQLHQRIALCLAFVVGAAGQTVAQQRNVYQPAGAPADPKVEARWNLYHDYAAATDLLRRLAAAHPELCRLQSLGKSYGGREMWVMTITNTNLGRETDKPAFWIDGAIHANEIQASEVVLYTAWYLAESYGRSTQISRLLDERVFYLMPMMSPDSRDAHFNKPNTTHSPRSGQRPVDDDKDGLVDEDGTDDLDGDGHITQMRIKDPNGRYKPHPDYPDLLVPVKGDEKGSYTLLGQEGYDNDGDGRVNEDGDGFYDPNRDWPWNWQPDYIQNGAHRYPFSILENRMVGDFIKAHPNIAGAQSFHNAGGMILRGPGAKDDRYDASDIAVYELIGKHGEEMLPGYKLMNVAVDLYEVYGGSIDWLHMMQGTFTFTNEMFTPFNFFRKPSPEGFFGRQEDQRAFEKYLLFGDGMVPWHEVDHPQYGNIEVGGPKKNWVRQPPSFLLEEECHRNMAFTLYHADQMPQVKVQSIDAKELASGLYEVTAAVVNQRVTPTHSSADLKNKITPPDTVSIQANAERPIRVIAGMQSDEQFFLRPEVQKRDPAKIKVASIAGMKPVYVRWIVEGAGPYTVNVKSVKGGLDEMAGPGK
jgi:Zinc carboxypeptidase